MKICLSPETHEEYSELISIMDDIGCSYNIYSNDAKKRFRLTSKIFDFFLFIVFLKKNGITVIIGAPCFRNRMARLILNVKYASYMRSLHPSSQISTSFSDSMYFFAKSIGIDSDWINPYSADTCFVSAEINISFLLERGIPKSIIYPIGAVWLNENTYIKPNIRLKYLVFISQAFIEHKHQEAHEEQLCVIRKLYDLVCGLKENSAELVIRLHPRDSYDYKRYLNENNIKARIDVQEPEKFKDSLSSEGHIVVSPFSTLGFELLHSGFNVAFISMDAIKDYEKSFNTLGVKYRVWKSIQCVSDLEILEQNKSPFIKYTAKYLKSYLNL